MHAGESLVAECVSAELAAMVRRAAPALVAVRIGPGHTASGFVWSRDLIVTSGGACSATIVLPDGREVVGECAHTARHAGLSAFRTPHSLRPLFRAETEAGVGAFVLALGAAADASPTARLALVRSAGTGRVRLDGSAHPEAAGGPVLDMAGGLLGMALAAPDGGWALLPWRVIAQAVEASAPGWLGAALQPTAVPARLRATAGQDSARRVIRLSPGGPAEAAGLRVGDILLALDGRSLTGPGTLRGLITQTEIGREVAARVMRGRRIETLALIVGADPNTPA
jgi:serine protease DegQ